MGFKMNFKSLPRCGAKARSNFGLPCRQAAMKNSRCYWHGGSAFIKHGHNTKAAQAEKAQHRGFVNEVRKSHSVLKDLITNQRDTNVCS